MAKTDGGFDPIPNIAAELDIPPAKVSAAVALLISGSTVPFIARYRKEATGDLDEVQIRAIEDRRQYLIDLDQRRRTIVASIEGQGKMTPDLLRRIAEASTKSALEDLYLPFKPKRRTRAAIARERGLEPLAERILAQPLDGDPNTEAKAFVSSERAVPDEVAALAGARDIVAERIAEDSDVRASLRRALFDEGLFRSRVLAQKAEERSKFEHYYDFQQRVSEIPSHRFLAIKRGETEGVLRADIELDTEKQIARIQQIARLDRRSKFAGQLTAAIADSYERLLTGSVETDVMGDLKLRSDVGAVEIFASNLRSLLLAAPLGEQVVIGIDPGLRTGCKCAVVDATGKFIENITLYLSQGPKSEDQAKLLILALVKKHGPRAFGIGNGTGGRETERFVRKVLKDAGLDGVIVVPVNEAGASVYSASDVARGEFPDLDLTVRGAISIARRLQDPLAELVKIDPQSIGVGQYQHDIAQQLLTKKLGEVVESCVNHVGVELNTASAPLLAHVAGIGPALAKRIVEHREKKGAFGGRSELTRVSGLGPRTFEQAAGFLRVREGEHPLDASAVHPERYALVEKMAADLGVELPSLLGDPNLAGRIQISRYMKDGLGEPTLRDITNELKKPGRDPRATFEPPSFRDDVNSLEDLALGMEFEGLVTNVTAFGAFVDIGVHQDGLVHTSQLANHFVKDPREVVNAGDKIKVRVLDVDLARRRIALTAKTQGAAEPRGARASENTGPPKKDKKPDRTPDRKPEKRPAPTSEFRNNPFARLLEKK